MAKNFSAAAKVFNSISTFSIYILAFILPVLFLPWTSDVLDINKQALLILLVFVSLFCQIAKVLITGKLSLNSNKTYIPVLSLFVAYVLSTIFSLDRYASFWGWPRSITESLLSVVCFTILYFLISGFLSRNEIFNSVKLLAISTFLVAIIGVFQLFGIYLFPFFSFGKSASFNTIGLVGSLGMFLAVLTPVLIFLEILSKKWLKFVFGFSLALIVIALILINYQIVWWITLAGATLVILFGIFKKELFDLRWLSLPIFFLVLALFFIILKPQISVPSRSIEVSLNQLAGFNIVLQSLKANPLLGSGPGTFIYDFLKYKANNFNQGTLWNIRFDGPGSKILTVASTTGALGLLSFLALIITVGYYGFLWILGKLPLDIKKNDSYFYLITGGIFIALIIQTAGLFLYDCNVSLDFLYFFLAACFIGLISGERKDFTLAPSSFLNLFVTFICTIFLIFGLGLMIIYGQKYAAEVFYYKGEMALVAGNAEEGAKNLEKAVNKNPSLDLYLTELSQVYLSQATNKLAKKDLTDEEKNNVQTLINNSINAAKMATDVSPNNVNNWSIRGYIYQSLIGSIASAEDWAITSYDKAQDLEPNNPYYLTQEGIVLIKKASILSADNIDEKNKTLELAKEKLNKAIELKSDYSLARFELAIVYQAQGKIDQEIVELDNAIKSSPNDTGLLFQIGIVYYQQGDYQSAKTYLEKAILLSPNYSNALYYLGLTYEKLGQADKALEKIQKLSELNPDNEQVKIILGNLQAGRSALDGLSPQATSQTPVEETPQKNIKK